MNRAVALTLTNSPAWRAETRRPTLGTAIQFRVGHGEPPWPGCLSSGHAKTIWFYHGYPGTSRCSAP